MLENEKPELVKKIYFDLELTGIHPNTTAEVVKVEDKFELVFSNTTTNKKQSVNFPCDIDPLGIIRGVRRYKNGYQLGEYFYAPSGDEWTIKNIDAEKFLGNWRWVITPKLLIDTGATFR